MNTSEIDPNTTTPASLVPTLERFGEIPLSYARVWQEMQRGVSARWNEAFQSYIGTLQCVREETDKQLQHAFQQYQANAQEALSKADSGKEYETASRSYRDLLNRTYEEAQCRHEEAARTCNAELLRAQEEAYARAMDAYRTYLQSMKDAWANLDVDAVLSVCVTGTSKR